jgi:hypothetical protein
LEVFESWDGIGVGEWGVAGFVEMESWCAALVRAKFTGEEKKDARTKSIEGTIRKTGNYHWEKLFAKWDTRTREAGVRLSIKTSTSARTIHTLQHLKAAFARHVLYATRM